MEEQRQRHQRIVLLPCLFQGHINPMLQLGSILHSKGFSITITHTQFNFPNTLNHPNFNFLPIVDGFSNCNVSSVNFIDVISGFNSNCKAPLQELMAQMMEAKEYQDEITCIIYDEYMYFAEAVANHLKLPSIILSTSSATNTLSFHTILQLLKDSHISTQDSMSPELVPELQPLRFKDLPISNFNNIEDLLQLIAKAHETRISTLHDRPFHKIAPAASSSLMEEDNSCIAWLDEQMRNSVIYVSLGSIASMKKKELAEMAWGLANSKQPFLWVSLPDGFKEAVGERRCIVKWAPQKEVLAHSAIGGFWSHCGWNSTLESICEGVPMICQAFFGDQRVHARYLSQVRKIGMEWENNLGRGEIERAIRKLMVDREGEEMRQQAMELKEKIDDCMKEGGSSYNSLNVLVDYILSL
ncbi:hypothetical protein ACB092_08G070500 [Castanea dentata]